jgi:peptidoglycan hydrolase-like protein with peptidoglycan-binding domain
VPRRSSRRETTFETAGRFAAVIGEHPREFVAIVMATVATFAIFVNALFLQKGPHPAPIFAARSMLQREEAMIAPRIQGVQPNAAIETSALARTQMIASIQRELTRKGFYDGPADGIWGSKTDIAVRDFAQAAAIKINPEASDTLLRAIIAFKARPQSAQGASATTGAANGAADPAPADPIAKLIAPSKRVTAIQRALSEFGYGQIKPTGQFDPETKMAIEKFERDRKLPVTGQISDRVVRELAATTGRPLE